MELSIDGNGQFEKEIKEITGMLNRAAILLSSNNTRKMFGAIGNDIMNDTKGNIRSEKTFDDRSMPPLKLRTVAYKKKIKKTHILIITRNLLNSIKISRLAPDFVAVADNADYAPALNDRKEKYGGPFKFMGFGRKLLAQIKKRIDEHIMRNMFR